MTDREARNAHYGMLNERFDARARLLLGMGFRQERIEGYDLSAFVRPRVGFRKPAAVAASFVLCADDVCWEDKLEELRR